jgi:hypothetical protein
MKPGHRANDKVAMNATAPPRLHCVMPAIELGWETFHVGTTVVVAARAAPLTFLPCFLSRVSRPGRRVVVAVSVAVVAVTPACACALSHTPACPCTRACCLGGKVEPLASFSPSTEPRQPARRTAVAFVAWLP